MRRPENLTGWSVSKKFVDLNKKDLVIVKNPANDAPNNLLYITKKEYDDYKRTGSGPVACNSKYRELCSNFVVFYSRAAAQIETEQINSKFVALDFGRKKIVHMDDDDVPAKLRKVYDEGNEKQILADAQKKFPSKGVVMTHGEFFDLLTKSKYPSVTPYVQFIKDLLVDKNYKPSEPAKSTDPVDVSELFDEQ